MCERYGLPYTSGPLYKQYAGVLATIARLALPGGGPAGSGRTSAQTRDHIETTGASR
jgi:linoleoyl-CoA desaturase